MTLIVKMLSILYMKFKVHPPFIRWRVLSALLAQKAAFCEYISRWAACWSARNAWPVSESTASSASISYSQACMSHNR